VLVPSRAHQSYRVEVSTRAPDVVDCCTKKEPPA